MKSSLKKLGQTPAESNEVKFSKQEIAAFKTVSVIQIRFTITLGKSFFQDESSLSLPTGGKNFFQRSQVFNQIFHYTCCITPKRLTNLWEHLCTITPVDEVASLCQPLSDLTGTRFEVQTFRSRNECAAVRPTGLFKNKSQNKNK